MTPTAATAVAGVIGDPVRHSLSPVLHNAAFAAAGLDWVYVAFPVPAGRGADAVTALRALGLRGLSVTMPHKADVVAAVDRLTATAARLESVNTVIAGHDVVGDSTDGAGLVRSLQLDHGWDPQGRTCVVLGAGGAARAATLALAAAGAARVGVVARRADAAAGCAALADAAGEVVGVDVVAGAELVVDATSVGMAGRSGPALPFDLDPGRLGPGQLVVDLVYAPLETPLLRLARQRGAAGANGLGMLVHQAALQFEAWTGLEAPVAAMVAAVGAGDDGGGG